MTKIQRSSRRDVVVIGASAGGIAALSDVMRGLPANFPAAIFLVVHTSPDNPGVLPQILRRAGVLPVEFARDGEPIVVGRVYVAPPDHHLLLKRDHIRVVRGPKENGFRPAVDPLFRTAAATHGASVIGVVLSGGLNDGTHGLADIVERGGVALAQDPADALIPSMPLHAIQNVEVRRVLAAVDIPAALIELIGETVAPADTPDTPDTLDTLDILDIPDAPDAPDAPDMAEAGDSLQAHSPPDPPTPYTCPECGGALWEHAVTGRLLRFCCRVGHAYTAEILVFEQEHSLENVLWRALRALEENAALCRRMGERSKASGSADLARRYDAGADHGERRAAVLRKLLQGTASVRTSQSIDTLAAAGEKPERP